MIEQLQEELKQLGQSSGLKSFSPYIHKYGAEIEIRGKRTIDFTSFDFFNLRQDPRLKKAALAGIEAAGFGSSSSRLLSGTSLAHVVAEKRLASFLMEEDAVFFSSRNQSTLSLITALLGERDAVLVDEICQSPVVDAAYLVGAESHVFNADVPASLISGLEKTTESRRILVFFESLSPITGQVRDVPVLLSAASRHGAFVVLDESSAIGSIGLRGAGACDFFNLQPGEFARQVDLSMALCSYGAAICASKELISYLVNKSRTFFAEAAPPPTLALIAERCIDIIELSTHLRQQMLSLASLLRSEVKQSGFSVVESGSGPIVSIQLKSYEAAKELALALFSRGVLVDALKTGITRSESAVVRFIITASHTELQIMQALSALAQIQPRISK
jgi:7-keto-8-aminopelargonate synthetase-like enzyme